MRIAIDASSILPAKTGIGYYTFHLVAELVARAPQHEFRLLLNSYRHGLPADAPFLNSPNVRRRRWRIPGPWLLTGWEKLHFPPLEILTGSFDLYHSTSSIVAPHWAGRRVVTVHDLYFERHPEHCHALGGLYLARTLRKGLEKADRIIAVSHATRRDLVERYGISTDRIEVIYEGVDPRFLPIDNRKLVDTFRTEYCLPESFILTVGTLEPRKNLPGLLQAYARLKEIYAVPPPLVIVGIRGWKTTGIYETLTELKIADDVIFTDYVDDQHMPLIYNAAKLFVFPSFFEGFGLPVLEAMACGLPVATSNADALTEIAGEAALFFDPSKPEEMAQAMRRLLSSKTARQDYVGRGLERAAQFNWRLTARKTIRCYEKVMAGG